MNILVAHNRYTFAGGEDEACATEVNLLRRFGHHVVVYSQDNREIDPADRWSTGVRSVWSTKDYAAVRKLIADEKLELLSVHNFFPLISPSVYYAARAEKIPVVQTLHNYRLLCPAATFLRDGMICEDCLGKVVPWPGIVHRCYRDSLLQTTSVAGMLSLHTMVGTWKNLVDRYIALTPFMRDKFIAGGFPAERIVVKPNSVEDAGVGLGQHDNFVFAGRLCKEKGVAVLLQAWAATTTTRKLKIIGTGPDEMSLRAYAARLPNVEFLGQISREQVNHELAVAAALVFPSVWYEGLSRVVVEAFSKGTPVIASDLGPMPSIVTANRTGILFKTGDALDLTAKLSAFPSAGPELGSFRAAAREEYERLYTDEVVYRDLMKIYKSVLRKD